MPVKRCCGSSKSLQPDSSQFCDELAASGAGTAASVSGSILI